MLNAKPQGRKDAGETHVLIAPRRLCAFAFCREKVTVTKVELQYVWRSSFEVMAPVPEIQSGLQAFDPPASSRSRRQNSKSGAHRAAP